MKIIKVFLCLTLCVLSVFALSSCDDGKSSAIIYYGITDTPKTIDPQLSNQAEELMIVRNLFEGLFRLDANGNIVNGVISGYEKNGLKYTFRIKENLIWSDGTPLTSNDFVFAFKRALSPETKSPYASIIFSIKNAEKVYNGELSASALGVTANGNHELIIELEYDDSNFLNTLTTSVCMPCNEEFFKKSVGKYGMSYETTLSNGSYKLTKWNTEDFAMRIAKNSNYQGSFIPQNAAIYFSKSKDYSTLESLKKNYVDLAKIDSADLTAAKNGGFDIKTINNKVVILSLGQDFPYNIRKSLFLSCVEKNINSVFPEILNVTTSNFNLYDTKTAYDIYSSEVKLLKWEKFPQGAITYYGDENVTNTVKEIAGNWQKYLGIYINIEKANSSEAVLSSLSKKDHITVYTVDINQNDISRYAKNFGITYNGNPEDTQNEILNSYTAIPIAYGASHYASVGNLSNVIYFDSNGIIDFSFITKKQ